MEGKYGVLAYNIFAAAEELTNYLEGCSSSEEVDRDKVMRLVHEINRNYVLWADDVDKVEVEVVD